MASRVPEYWNATAAEHKKITLPDKFMCRDCKKLKDPPQFSNKEVNNFRWKKASGGTVNGVTAKLRCRICTGEQVTELQCTGPCGLWKSLDEFSRAQRRLPGIAWCDRCTQWKEANEPSVTPMPAPNTIVAPDEEGDVLGAVSQIYLIDIEGDSDSDDEGTIGIDLYACKAVSSLTISGEVDEYSLSRTRPERSNQRTTRPSQESSLNTPYGTRTEIPDEHMMTSMRDSSQNSSSNNENIKILSKALGDGLDTVEGGRPAPIKAYNAWDNSGEMHTQVRVPSMASSSASNPTQSNLQSTNVSSGRSAWAKPIGTKFPAKQFPITRRLVKQTQYNADEEDSPDEL